MKKPLSKRAKIIIVVIIIALAAGGGILAFFLLNRPQETAKEEASTEVAAPPAPKYYSKLTGLEIPDPKLNNSPLSCVQTPNGLDGARPQVGLSQAGVVFEAIAEAGITRFAAIYQNPTSSVIGPIRSLRSYYLEWDVPFDCTIVHAGGADDAIAALYAGGYLHLNESYTYMWRDYTGYYAPNNLMTSAALLSQFNNDNGYTTANFTAFPRQTPEQATAAQQAAKPAEDGEGNATPAVPIVSEITIQFGNTPAFNTIYNYDQTTNTYLRSYATGQPHLVYNCPADLEQPAPQQDCGEPVQLAPAVVIAMLVDEWRAADGYHEDITTIGSGTAYVFQNGTATKATWRKPSVTAQIEFTDQAGQPIALAPGQTWIAAVPNSYGSVNY